MIDAWLILHVLWTGRIIDMSIKHLIAATLSVAIGLSQPPSPINRLFTQDTYTEYTLLDPGTEQFRIRFRATESRAGSSEFDWIRFESQLLLNVPGIRNEGENIEVYDPRTGKPLKFAYGQAGGNENSYIRVSLPGPVPVGGLGRVLIYKTFKDAQSYLTHGDDIVWTRNLIGYRVGVVLPKGYAFISSNVAAQLTTLPDGRLKLAFANASGGQSNPVTIHARKINAIFTPLKFDDMFFDDMKTLYNLDAPETHGIHVEQTYSDFRKGDKSRLDSLSYLRLHDLKVIDLDTAKAFTPVKEGAAIFVKLDVPIVGEKQSAHLKITGTLEDTGYRLENGHLIFERTLYGLRNTVLLPEGWEVAAVSQSGTIGSYRGRVFVAFVNLNAENTYKVTIRARKQ
jgi:hypothetical protein